MAKESVQVTLCAPTLNALSDMQGNSRGDAPSCNAVARACHFGVAALAYDPQPRSSSLLEPTCRHWSELSPRGQHYSLGRSGLSFILLLGICPPSEPFDRSLSRDGSTRTFHARCEACYVDNSRHMCSLAIQLAMEKRQRFSRPTNAWLQRPHCYGLYEYGWSFDDR